MKRILAIVMSLFALAATLGGCSGSATEPILKDGESDIEYITNKGTLKIGVTDFAPMDYHDDNDEWVGFDAELAKKFAEELGVVPEFVEIDWDKKTDLLTDGTIDVVWNGMTLTDDLKEKIDCSEPYLSNSQVIVMQNDKIQQYETVEKCQHLLFSAEDGSSGEEILSGMKYRYSVFPTQKDALKSVLEGKTDCAVIDIIMAGYYTTKESDFSSLGYEIKLDEEKISVGLRKNSDLTEKANEFLKELYESGEMTEIAAQYGIEDAVLGL